MSILKKLFGADAEELLRKAREREEKGDVGGAVLEYERALEALGEGGGEGAAGIRGKTAALRDRLADRSLEEAALESAAGRLDRAGELLAAALEVCGSAGKRVEIEGKIEEHQRRVATGEAGGGEAKFSEDDLYQALSGAWSQPQLDELDGYGARFEDAFLALHRGELDAAIAGMKTLLDEAGEDALYLHMEYARACMGKAAQLAQEKEAPPPPEGEETSGPTAAEGLRTEAVSHLRRFFELLPRRKTPEVRAEAWSLIAQASIDMKDMESAEDALVQAQNLLPAEPGVYVNLGRFLLSQERQEDAIAALEAGEKAMDGLHPNVDLVFLLAGAYRKAGKKKAAAERYEKIISYYMAIGRLEWDAAVALPLAAIYEEEGMLLQACDLYRNLSTGSDKESLGRYNYEAARLLVALGRGEDEARPFLLRAEEYAQDEELKEKIAALQGR